MEYLILGFHFISNRSIIFIAIIFYISIANTINQNFSIDTDDEFRKDAFLFGEAQSRVVVSVDADNLDEFVEMISDSDVDFMNLGEVTNGEILMDGIAYGAVADYKNKYENAIADKMKIK